MSVVMLIVIMFNCCKAELHYDEHFILTVVLLIVILFNCRKTE
jgi:hypothetical protein